MNPSEGLEWSAGSYNPQELEQWKRKIYGLEYYDDETPAEAPIWNQPNGEPIPIVNNNNNDNENNGSSSNNDSSNNDSNPDSSNIHKNIHSNSSHGSSRGILRTNSQHQKYKYSKNDTYFNNNIAAIAANWDDEDNHNHSYCFNFPITAKLQEYFDKYLKKQKRGVWIIVLAVMTSVVATVAMFRMARTDAFANNNSPTAEIRERPSLFDTSKEASLLDSPEISASSSSSSLFDTTKADLLEEPSNNNYNSDEKPSPFETKTAQLIVEERNSPGGENHGKLLRSRNLLLEDVKTKSQINN